MASMVETAQTLAELHHVNAEEIAAATTKNFARLFNLPPDVGN